MALDLFATGGGVHQQRVFMSSGTFTCPKSGAYLITAIGPGGGANSSRSGGAGGLAQKRIALALGTVITFNIGAGGVGGSTGTDGGITTCTATGLSLTANGGQGGTNATPLGGTASGGDTNVTGGGGGSTVGGGAVGVYGTGHTSTGNGGAGTGGPATGQAGAKSLSSNYGLGPYLLSSRVLLPAGSAVGEPGVGGSDSSAAGMFAGGGSPSTTGVGGAGGVLGGGGGKGSGGSNGGAGGVGGVIIEWEGL